MDNSVQFLNVSKFYGKTNVIESLNLEIRRGERMVLLGPSGCGKSTILRMISGLESITKGELYLNGELANDIDPGDRNIAMVFQNYALFPHMKVKANIAYGLNINKVPKMEVENRVKDVLDVLNLNGFEDRLPRELSGGQRQRVALARALVKRADFILLDEPLSNLDAQLRARARKELVSLHEIYRQTFIYVTHDQVEAMTIGHRIALFDKGKLQMLDTPDRVYHRPANVFAATFIGSPSTNIMEVRYDCGRIHLDNSQSFKLSDFWIERIQNSGVKRLLMGIRPEDVRLHPPAFTETECLDLSISYVEDYGNRTGYYFNIGGQEVISIMPERVLGLFGVPGADNAARWQVFDNKLHFFDADTTTSIGYPEAYR
jgi:sn-glycerol 3-phosphate transport system ATP-binding protein